MDCLIPDKSFRIYPIRGYLGSFHLLYEASRQEAVLIDTGLVGEMAQLAHILKKSGLGWRSIKAVLLTHGHLDHTGHLAQIKELTGAPIFAHPLDQPHIDGTFPYQGASRLCGFMESVGRKALRYRTAKIDEPFSDGVELPYWGGLKVMHLPGHTEGHCGFYSQRFNLLFSGDLFASYWFSTHQPPAFLNSCPEKLPASVRRADELSSRYIIPSHYDVFDAEKHAVRFKGLVARSNSSP